MNNLRKFSTEADYSAATLNYPAVSWVTATDNVYFNKTAPAAFNGLTVYYNITGGGSGSGSGELAPTVLFHVQSGSGSGSGGALPSAMIIDGTAVEVTNTYQFSTAGEHIVNYSFADNQIPKGFLSDGSGIFSTVTKVEIDDAITSIGNSAFYYCSSLTSCTLGSGVTTIGDYAFASCSGLTSIDIPSGVTSIGNGAFASCRSLASIDIPDSVTSIGNYAFNGCSSLTSIEIPSDVTSIGDDAFRDCTNLASITSNPMTAPTLGLNTFSSISYNGVLTVPSGSQGYCDWIINGGLPGYWTIDGVTCE